MNIVFLLKANATLKTKLKPLQSFQFYLLNLKREAAQFSHTSGSIFYYVTFPTKSSGKTHVSTSSVSGFLPQLKFSPHQTFVELLLHDFPFKITT